MSHHTKNSKINYKTSFIYFVIPLVSLLFAVIDGQNEGLWGMIACFFFAVYAVGLLLFKPSLGKKHAAWSFMLGYFVSLLFFAIIAYVNLYGG